MNISLNTDQTTQKMIQNMEDVYRAIEQHYYIPHTQRREDSSLSILFGPQAAKYNRVEFSRFAKTQPKAILSVRIDNALCQQLTGYTISEIGKVERELRTEKGNEVANAYPSTFKEQLDAFFGKDLTTLRIDNYMAPHVDLILNIEQINDAVIKAISIIMQHSTMLPKPTENATYDL